MTEPIKLCWRHTLAMTWAALGTLLDLTGRTYRQAADKVFEKADQCPKCTYRRIR